MRFSTTVMVNAGLAVVLWLDPAFGQSGTRPTTAASDPVQTILQLCLATGQRQQIDGTLTADGRIRLTGPSLSAHGDVTLSREEWAGLIGGISPNMTAIQAQQADRVRDCLAPARDAIVRRLLAQ
jgi:hypothetical protein